MNKCLFLISVSILGMSCNGLLDKSKDPNLVAEAYGKKLYIQEIVSGIGNFNNPIDSQIAATRFIDEWLIDLILFEEAQKKLKDKKRIQKLIQDYERSLYISELENRIVKNLLDTVVAQEAIDTFYLKHSEDFKLSEPIVRLLLIRLDSVRDTSTLKNLWTTEDLPALKIYVEKSQGLAFLDPQEWQYISDLRSISPESLFAKISLNRPGEYALEQNDQHFYLKVLEIIDQNDLPPMEFVKERIKLRILQDRIKALLKSHKSELFNEKIQSKEIKIYGNKNN
ncbi:MAG: hypothetical protein ACO3MG_01870 [Saprospiraceae bacterium]|nr:hypothetical protein [Chitinophagia bacterium]